MRPAPAPINQPLEAPLPAWPLFSSIGFAAGLAVGALICMRRRAPLTSGEQFRRSVRAHFPVEIALHRDIAVFLEPYVDAPRPLDTPLRLALDMLFTQAYKAHYSVKLLVEAGHMEDAATITRRLLELGAASIYILSADTAREVEDRARRYLSHLWDELPPEGRQHLPPEARAFWEGLRGKLPRGPWPGWQKIFSELGASETYNEDYSLLANIAHGVSPAQVVAYSRWEVPIRDTRHLGGLLRFASRYYLGVADSWNRECQLIDAAALANLVERAAA